MFNNFENIEIEFFGESHSSEIGVLLRNFPENIKIDLCQLQNFVNERKAKNNFLSTKRFEEDKIEILSGIENGVITGQIIKAVIKNKAQNSEDYDYLKYTPRPSHADYVCYIKDQLEKCPIGGGRFSGRMTAPLCIAGGIAKQILLQKNIEIVSYIRSIGEIEGNNFDNLNITADKVKNIKTKIKAFSRVEEMEKLIKNTAQIGDSIGGVVDCIVFGLPIGYGDNLFKGLEGRIAQSVFGVPAVKGVSFGGGFNLAKSYGSKVNDSFYYNNNKVETLTNYSGGINGGISNGMPITLSVAFRPTPSISIPQKTINLKEKTETTIEIKGRHDVCVALRGAVAVESAVALAILDVVM